MSASHGESHHAVTGSLMFNSGATPAHVLVARMAFDSIHPLAYRHYFSLVFLPKEFRTIIREELI